MPLQEHLGMETGAASSQKRQCTEGGGATSGANEPVTRGQLMAMFDEFAGDFKTNQQQAAVERDAAMADNVKKIFQKYDNGVQTQFDEHMQ